MYIYETAFSTKLNWFVCVLIGVKVDWLQQHKREMPKVTRLGSSGFLHLINQWNCFLLLILFIININVIFRISTLPVSGDWVDFTGLQQEANHLGVSWNTYTHTHISSTNTLIRMTRQYINEDLPLYLQQRPHAGPSWSHSPSAPCPWRTTQTWNNNQQTSNIDSKKNKKKHSYS